ncbi:MAG: GAF domain-containing protein, partial [Gemmatimonadales bacterium]
MSEPAAAEPGGWSRLYGTRPLIALAIVAGWVAIYYSYRDSWLGIVIALLSTALGLLTLRRGRTLAERRRERSRRAYEDIAARNQALDRLRGLAATLLAGTDLTVLFHEVAQAAADLLGSDAGEVTLVVEEGRFLRIAAATGPVQPMIGHLLPMETSLSGWVVTHGEPLISEDVNRDPRDFVIPPPAEIRNAVIVPLISVDVVIGTVGAFNRKDGRSFTENDLHLLKILGDQAVVGIDRAQVISEIRQNEGVLAQKNEELQRATELKNEFLANMSH